MKPLINQPLRIFVYALVSCIFILNSCSKNKEDKMVTKTDLITSGAWKTISHTISPAYDYNGDGIDDTNVFQFYEPCEKDNTSTFKKDGTGITDEGGLKCDPSDPQTEPFTWHFFNNETQISIGYYGISLEFQILELTSNKMTLSYSYEDTGVTYTETVGFSK